MRFETVDLPPLPGTLPDGRHIEVPQRLRFVVPDQLCADCDADNQPRDGGVAKYRVMRCSGHGPHSRETDGCVRHLPCGRVVEACWRHYVGEASGRSVSSS